MVLIPAVAGLLAGASHALSGPDHLAAVLPLAAEAPERAARTSLRWGLGHGAGTTALLVAALLLHVPLDLDAVGARAETLIGGVLVVTGSMSAVRAWRGSVSPRTPDARAFGMGTLHGMAGGTHLVATLGALALRPVAALAWAGAFLTGAATAMTLLGLAAARAGRQWPPEHQRRVQIGASILSVAVGGMWMVVAT